MAKPMGTAADSGLLIFFAVAVTGAHPFSLSTRLFLQQPHRHVSAVTRLLVSAGEVIAAIFRPDGQGVDSLHLSHLLWVEERPLLHYYFGDEGASWSRSARESQMSQIYLRPRNHLVV